MKRFFTAVFLLFLPLVLLAQDSGLHQKGYDETIPKFKDVTGYETGKKFTPHFKIVEYIKAVSESSDRILLRKYGETYEGRPLYILIISTPENLENLENYTALYRKLTNPGNFTNDKEVKEKIEDLPACVWLSYNVHGNEASCSEAAMAVIYELAASLEQSIQELLENLIIVIDPVLNPDGRDRYTNWINSAAGKEPNPDPNSAEHDEQWPGGRTNHYYFDLNRDWVWLTQKETRYRIKAYREFMPQIHVDFHEMSYRSTYFFFPSAKPVNVNIPESIKKWQDIFGRGNAEAFDERGWKYYTGESFDLFYPGYGDSWPSLNGAVGMTYEQAGGSGGAMVVKLDEKRKLSLKDRVMHHFVASVSTLKTASKFRNEKLFDFYLFFKDVLNKGENGDIKAFIFKESGDRNKDEKLMYTLLAQGIEIHKTSEDFTLNKAYPYFNNTPVKVKIEAGSYIIPLAQPQRNLVKTLFEPEPAMPDTFFYDITAWSIPMAFGLDAYYTTENLNVKTEVVKEYTVDKKEFEGDIDGYAFLIPWGVQANSILVYKLLKEDFKGSFATKDFTISGKKFKRGTVVFFNKKNGEEFKYRIKELTDELGAKIFSVQTGYSEKGIDLGSNRFRELKKPKIVVLMDSPVSSTAYGSIWFTLDCELDIDFTPVRVDRFKYLDLSDYNVLILPPDWGTGRGYKRVIDEESVEKIKEWIKEGGTFIGISGGAYFASKNISGITDIKVLTKPEEEEDKKKKKEKDKKMAMLSYEEKMKKRRLDRIPGTIFKVNLDVTHPLAYGNEDFVYVLKRENSTFELSKDFNNIGIYTRDPKLSGYIPPESNKFIPESVFFTEKSMSKGRVILFSDELNFRSFWNGLTQLLINSIIFGPSL